MPDTIHAQERRATHAAIFTALAGTPQRLIAMTGAKDFVGGDDYLQFRLMRNKTGGNMIKISIDRGTDLYTIEALFASIKGVTVKASETGLYDEMLRPRFEAITGLALSVPRIANIGVRP